MRALRHLILLSALLLVAAAAHAQSDVVIAQRQPVVCNPQGTTPYSYYDVGDGKWHCTATAPVVFMGGAKTTITAHTVASLNDSTSTASGTVQSTEYTLNSVTIPANALNAATRGIKCTAFGTGAANANAKNIKFYLGGTSMVTLTGTTDNAKAYVAEMTVLRTGSSTQSVLGAITSDVGAPDALTITAATITDTADIVIALKTANTAAAAASATGKGLSCLFLN